MYRSYTKVERSPAITTIDTAGIKHTFVATKPVRITRFGCVLTTATTVAASVLTLDHHLASGANLGVDQANVAGDLTVPVSAINTGFYKEAADFTGGKPVLVLPGEVVDIVTDGGSTAGDGYVFLEYEEEPFVDAKVQRGTAAREQTADDGYLDNMTKVTA